MARAKTRGGAASIAISGYGQEKDLRRSRDAGFVEHIIKPIDINVLKNAIEAHRPV